MDRMEKTAKVLNKVLTVLKIILIVACGLTVVVSLALIIWAKPITTAAAASGGTTTFNSGIMHATFNTANMSAGNLQLLMLMVLIATLVIVALFVIAIMLLQRLLKDIGDGHPFAPEAPGLIRRLAILIFVGSVVVPLVSSLVEWFSFRAIGIQNVVATTANGTTINMGTGFNFSINLTTIVIGFIVLLLAYVFEYGVHLQNQADETL